MDNIKVVYLPLVTVLHPPVIIVHLLEDIALLSYLLHVVFVFSMEVELLKVL